MRILAFLICFTCTVPAFCQQLNWLHFDTSIAKKKNLLQLNDSLEAIKSIARQSGADITTARCWYYQLQIADIRTDDSLFFSNSYFIDSLLRTPTSTPLMRSMMHLIQAGRLAFFKRNFSYGRRRALMVLPRGTPDYRSLSALQLDSSIQWHFQQAKLPAAQQAALPIQQLLWLSNDPLLFLFKPAYNDLVFAEQVSYLKSNLEYTTNVSVDWLSIAAGDLLKQDSLPREFHHSLLPVYRVYKEWAGSNTNYPEAYYFIEALARQYFYLHNLIQEDKLYEQSLLQYLQSRYAAVRVFAVYKLGQYWKELGDKYPGSQYMGSRRYGSFDTAYRSYLARAIQLFQQSATLLDSFLYLKQQIGEITRLIQSPFLQLSTQTKLLPQDSIPLGLKFQNIDTAFYSIIRLDCSRYLLKSGKLDMEQLKGANAIRSGHIILPLSADFQLHSATLQLAGLQTGYYVLLYHSDNQHPATSQLQYFTFQVTNLAVLNNGNRIYVLNRSTGKPVNAAKLVVYYQNRNDDQRSVQFKTNVEGYANTWQSALQSVVVINGSDTMSNTLNEGDQDKPRDAYDKEEDDDLLEYYQDHLNLHLFTDRAIYRPGQKVHFKGILMTRNPANGAPIILSKHNLRLGMFRKLFSAEARRLGRGEFYLYLENAFGKQVDSFAVKCNDYGSFTGNFQLGGQAATGEWEFDTDDIDIDNQNSGSFKVEEYKRPTFELKLFKPENYLTLGDSFFVKVKVNSFAGASLNNVSIRYSVRVDGYCTFLPVIDCEKNQEQINQQLTDSTATTNANGELLIKVPAEFLKAYAFNNEEINNLNYTINVTAIDATGESHDERLQVRIDNRPVKINAGVKKIYERTELKQLSIAAKSLFSGSLVKPLTVEIYKNDEFDPPANDNTNVDYAFVSGVWNYVHTVNQLPEAKRQLIYSAVVDSGGFTWPAALMNAGKYELSIRCIENGELIGSSKLPFIIFEVATDEIPSQENEFKHLPSNAAVSGDSIKWFTGSVDTGTWRLLHAQYYATTKEGTRLQHQYAYQLATKKISQWTIHLPPNAVEGTVELTQLYVLHNQLVIVNDKVFINRPAATNPEIIVEQYRRVLTPGSAGNFVVSIKTGNDQLAAELLTTMYDASLDKLEPHKWRIPQVRQALYNRTNWLEQIYSQAYGTFVNRQQTIPNFPAKSGRVQPLWWLNPLDYAYDSLMQMDRSPLQEQGNMNMLAGKVAGINITSSQGLNEVVVVGYGTSKKLTASSTIRIRGTTSLSSYNIPLVIIDGVMYSGDLNNIYVNSITDGIVLKGADATALYGARASNGVIVLSTKGKVQLPAPEAPPVVVRKNFAETAFFLPQVHADAKGVYNIQFEIPKSVTEWNWKLFAHTKAAQFVTQQKKVHTQLPLMVQPNMPRFLYQGDVIQLQARITNLDTLPLNGSSNCRIEDAVTGEDITRLLLKQDQQDFRVDRKSNNHVGYLLAVPDTFLHPIKIRVTARAGSFSDGEEYTIPVMSKAILVVQSLPFVLKQKDTLLQLPVLPNDATIHGLALYVSSKPQAALINALPYLANYSYNCAEQTVNKLLANVVALQLIRTDTIAQRTMRNLPVEAAAKTDALPGELGEQTMPWLQLGNANQQQQQQLQRLFDSSRAKQTIVDHMNRLLKLQTADGGSAWFDGGKSDRYISNYLLNAFGCLKAQGLPLLFNNEMNQLFNRYLPKLVEYCDEQVNSSCTYTSALMYLYARRHWNAQFPASARLNQWSDSILNITWPHADDLNLNEQAMLVSVSLVFKGSELGYYKKAMAQLESLRQLAVTDVAMGTRWKVLSNSDDLSNTAEETISNLATAYKESGQDNTVVAGIIQWLLQAKAQHAWSNTKATAAVVGLLQQQQPSPTGLPITLNSGTLQVTDNLLQGQLIAFKTMDQFLNTLAVQQSGNELVKGGFNLYYFTSMPATNEVSTGINIRKQLQRFNKSNATWEPIDSSTQLQLADQLRTTITIQTRKPLQYVLIDDKRAAAMEPSDGSSGYHYGDGWSYYQSVRDASHQFFASNIPSGESTIHYETIVSKTGQFTNGPVSLQCMYQPALRVYGGGGRIVVEE